MMKIYIRTRSRTRDYYTKNFDNEEVKNEELEKIEVLFNSSPFIVDGENNIVFINGKAYLFIPRIKRNVDYRGVYFYFFIEFKDDEEIGGVNITELEKLLNENITERKIDIDEEKKEYVFDINKFNIEIDKNFIDNVFCIKEDKIKKVENIDECKKKFKFSKSVIFSVSFLILLGILISWQTSINKEKMKEKMIKTDKEMNIVENNTSFKNERNFSFDEIIEQKCMDKNYIFMQKVNK